VKNNVNDDGVIDLDCHTEEKNVTWMFTIIQVLNQFQIVYGITVWDGFALWKETWRCCDETRLEVEPTIGAGRRTVGRVRCIKKIIEGKIWKRYVETLWLYIEEKPWWIHWASMENRLSVISKWFRLST